MSDAYIERHVSLRLDVIAPVLNERELVPELIERISGLRTRLQDERSIDLHLFIVDDGSTDGTHEVLETVQRRTPWLTVVLLLRNFGHQQAVSAGLDQSCGDYVCIIDGDLQDPPEIVFDMLDRLVESGKDVVYGKREQRRGETKFKLATATIFYRLLRKMSGIDIPLDTGDFRVMSARVVDGLRLMPEKHRFLRAMIPWMGFSSEPFAYHREARRAGQSKYPLRKMMGLGAHAVASFSSWPFRAIQMIGILTFTAGWIGLLLTGILAIWATGMTPWMLAALCLAVGGTNLLALSIIGGYIARIQDETKGRPLYLIDRIIAE